MTVLDLLEHSGLGVTDNVDLVSGHVEVMSNLEPLEHSVRSTTVGGGPMEGARVLEPLEHSVLEKTLNGRPMEGIAVLEPLEHSVPEIALDSGLIKDWSVLGPLEHSVLEEASDVRPKRVRTILESLEHSVPDVVLVRGDCSFIRMTELDPLEHSGLSVTVHVDMDSRRRAPWDAGGTLRSTNRHRMAIWKDVVRGVVRISRMPLLLATGCLRSFGGLGRSCIIDLYAGEDDLVLGAAVIDRVTSSSMEVQFSTCGVTSHIDIMAGLVGRSTEGDVQDQYGTFNGMLVYYGDDLYDSEDSDWDDPYALASAAYIEDYNFDVPEGMDLMVHRHSRILDSFGVQQDCQIDVAPVYQTVSYTTKDEWDTSDNDSLTATADEDDPNMDDFYQRVLSLDDENYFDSDDGSITDFDSSMSEGEYYVVLDDGSMTDLDGDMSQEVDCGDSDDRDMLEYEDYGDSDVWSMTDLDSYRLDVDEEDCCDLDDRDMLEYEDYGDSDVWSVTDLDSYRSYVDEEDCCDSDDRDMLEDFVDSDVADLECLNYLGRNCIMDFSAGWTLFPSESGLTGLDGP